MLNILKYGQRLGKGFFASFSPSVVGGLLVDLFREKKVDTKKATEWVVANKSLWDSLDPERQRQFKQFAGMMGDLNWMNVDWAIKSLRGDFPALASLFLGWKKANNWLARQVEIIKTELQK